MPKHIDTNEVIDLAQRILETIRIHSLEREGLDGNIMASGLALAITLIGRDIDPMTPEIVATILTMKHPRIEPDKEEAPRP